MNKIILCEGKSDAVLLSYYLGKICEDKEAKVIVDKCKTHVDELKNQCSKKYLNKERLVQKAYLSSTWAIQSPEKVFSFIDEQIKSVKWEDSKTLRTCFEELLKI